MLHFVFEILIRHKVYGVVEINLGFVCKTEKRVTLSTCRGIIDDINGCILCVDFLMPLSLDQ